MLLNNRKYYISYIVGLPIIFIFITAIIIGGCNIYSLSVHHNEEIEHLEKDFMDKQKSILVKNVEMTNTRVSVFEKNMYILLKKRLKNKSTVGFTIANSIYNEYKDTKTEQEIKKMIFTAINKISWRDDNNYFWVVDYDGIEQIAPPKYKNFIGKNISHIQDNKGNFVIQDEINLVKTHNEGYLYNTFIKSLNSKEQFNQISYVKALGFYDWYIGTAGFIDDRLADTKKELAKRISEITFNGNNYIFILDVISINGGDKFAKMIVNKNRPDLIGKYLNDDYKDVKGKQFRKEILEKIRQNGKAWVEYHYRKPDGTVGKKLSYFYFNKDFNWIIANGFYFDDIIHKIDKRIEYKNSEIKEEILKTFSLTLVLASVLSIFSILLSRNIQKIINQYDAKLKSLNKNLAKMVTQEIDKNSKKDLMIFRQAKSALMGEMIGNIAHQWRQPLNSIGATMMKLELINEMKYDDSKEIVKIVDDTNQSLQYMSKTIDDFRNFFSPSQNKEEFFVHKVIDEAISIVKVQLDNLGVELTIDDQDGNIKVYGHKSELVQVLLNIINNSKDAVSSMLKLNTEYKPKINIIIKDTNQDVVITIEDNAGGISNNIIEKIFDPYFTTKFKSKGTGIGLYMSKMIIEKDMQGSLSVQNNTDGAVFTIVLRGGENLDDITADTRDC